jgi:hypothetical protein
VREFEDSEFGVRHFPPPHGQARYFVRPKCSKIVTVWLADNLCTRHKLNPAKIKGRFADEYDAAQERGEVAKQGQHASHVPNENMTAAITDSASTAKSMRRARSAMLVFETRLKPYIIGIKGFPMPATITRHIPYNLAKADGGALLGQNEMTTSDTGSRSGWLGRARQSGIPRKGN